MPSKNDLSAPAPSEVQRRAIGEALQALPLGVFLLTASHEERRGGMLVSFLQQVCFKPAMLCVAIAKGRTIMPLISESRRFGIVQLSEQDRALKRRFMEPSKGHEDPFLGQTLVQTVTPGLPILKQGVGYFECELSCHMDVEGDHDLFVGRIISGGPLNAELAPMVRLREDGFDY